MKQILDALTGPQKRRTPAQALFDDGRAFRVADAGNPFAAVSGQMQANDAVTQRGMFGQEASQRNALNALQLVFDELQANPDLLEQAHTLTGKAQNKWLSFRDRTGLDFLDLDPEQEEQVGDVARYRQRLLTNVNQYIKEITGATVGQGDETTRLMAVQPNEGDSPAQIIAKLQGAIEMGMLNVARARYMQGNAGDAPSDADLRNILSQRGRELYSEALRSGLGATEARAQAAQRLSEEFGF